MIPILFDSSETAFASNGLGRLRDCTSCIATEGRNDVYECDFSYPVTGSHYDDIQLGRIIGVTHDDTGDVQPFDIISRSRPINGIVDFHAVHISYRLTKHVARISNINTLSGAMAALQVEQVPTHLFSYQADFSANGYMSAANGIPQSVRSLLGGVEGSVLDTYGGEYEFDLWSVKLHQNRGKDQPLTIRYGTNLIDYKDDVDYSESYTSCVPYWTGTENDAEVIVVASLADSGQVSYNGQPAAVPLDLTSEFESKPSTAALAQNALAYMQRNAVSLPAQSIEVDFVSLRNLPEYETLKDLFECRLCDTVRVIFPMYGVDTRFKIVKTVYNVLLDRYDSLELGKLSTTLAEALGLKK